MSRPKPRYTGLRAKKGVNREIGDEKEHAQALEAPRGVERGREARSGAARDRELTWAGLRGPGQADRVRARLAIEVRSAGKASRG